jgi:hypothetical protein
MSVNIEASALSMPESLDSLELTPSAMHRIWFDVSTSETWYTIIKEANAQYGRNWRCQPRVKRRLERNRWDPQLITVWFEVPDPNFASWVAVKHAIPAKMLANK